MNRTAAVNGHKWSVDGRSTRRGNDVMRRDHEERAVNLSERDAKCKHESRLDKIKIASEIGNTTYTYGIAWRSKANDYDNLYSKSQASRPANRFCEAVCVPVLSGFAGPSH